MPIRIGCIADDFTGATDVAGTLVRAGMRVVQTIGTPRSHDPVTDVDAIVIALKTRTVPAAQAVDESLQALDWLRDAGAEQIYFKYCSTFDSTPDGNIGPVIDALMHALGVDFTVATPAFPTNGRTVFKGHLFVGNVLLSDSGMREHPLTPMTNSDLVAVLAEQSRSRIGLIDYAVVRHGSAAIRARMSELRDSGVGIAIVDAIDNDDLLKIGHAVAGLPLVTAGSGLAAKIPSNWGFQPSTCAAALPPPRGRQAILSGSVSSTTNAQVAEYLDRGHASFCVDPLRIAAGDDVVGAALARADASPAPEAILIYSTAEPDVVRDIQDKLGASRAGALVERTVARIGQGLIERGVRQLVIAGGETAGAVVQQLRIDRLRIGAEIDPGVPWCAAHLPGGDMVHVALKSGNFGSVDFFTNAFSVLCGAAK